MSKIPEKIQDLAVPQQNQRKPRKPRKPRSPRKPRVKEQKAKVSMQGKHIQVKSPYNEATVEAFRKIKGFWDSKAKVWNFSYEFREEIILILKTQGMKVSIDVPAKLNQLELDTREATIKSINSTLKTDRRKNTISHRMMKKLTEIGIGNVKEEIKKKAKIEKYGINKSEWMVNNINTEHWKKARNKITK